ncbi:RNA recognition motif domain [Trinorchestia longiramus]|nr:RNA recognition motif domain [Trinorchestia longiramus]
MIEAIAVLARHFGVQLHREAVVVSANIWCLLQSLAAAPVARQTCNTAHMRALCCGLPPPQQVLQVSQARLTGRSHGQVSRAGLTGRSHKTTFTIDPKDVVSTPGSPLFLPVPSLLLFLLLCSASHRVFSVLSCVLITLSGLVFQQALVLLNPVSVFARFLPLASKSPLSPASEPSKLASPSSSPFRRRGEGGEGKSGSITPTRLLEGIRAVPTASASNVEETKTLGYGENDQFDLSHDRSSDYASVDDSDGKLELASCQIQSCTTKRNAPHANDRETRDSNFAGTISNVRKHSRNVDPTQTTIVQQRPATGPAQRKEKFNQRDGSLSTTVCGKITTSDDPSDNREEEEGSERPCFLHCDVVSEDVGIPVKTSIASNSSPANVASSGGLSTAVDSGCSGGAKRRSDVSGRGYVRQPRAVPSWLRGRDLGGQFASRPYFSNRTFNMRNEPPFRESYMQGYEWNEYRLPSRVRRPEFRGRTPRGRSKLYSPDCWNRDNMLHWERPYNFMSNNEYSESPNYFRHFSSSSRNMMWQDSESYPGYHNDNFPNYQRRLDRSDVSYSTRDHRSFECESELSEELSGRPHAGQRYSDVPKRMPSRDPQAERERWSPSASFIPRRGSDRLPPREKPARWQEDTRMSYLSRDRGAGGGEGENDITRLQNQDHGDSHNSSRACFRDGRPPSNSGRGKYKHDILPGPENVGNIHSETDGGTHWSEAPPSDGGDEPHNCLHEAVLRQHSSAYYCTAFSPACFVIQKVSTGRSLHPLAPTASPNLNPLAEAFEPRQQLPENHQQFAQSSCFVPVYPGERYCCCCGAPSSFAEGFRTSNDTLSPASFQFVADENFSRSSTYVNDGTCDPWKALPSVTVSTCEDNSTAASQGLHPTPYGVIADLSPTCELAENLVISTDGSPQSSVSWFCSEQSFVDSTSPLSLDSTQSPVVCHECPVASPQSCPSLEALVAPLSDSLRSDSNLPYAVTSLQAEALYNESEVASNHLEVAPFNSKYTGFLSQSVLSRSESLPLLLEFVPRPPKTLLRWKSSPCLVCWSQHRFDLAQLLGNDHQLGLFSTQLPDFIKPLGHSSSRCVSAPPHSFSVPLRCISAPLNHKFTTPCFSPQPSVEPTEVLLRSRSFDSYSTEPSYLSLPNVPAVLCGVRRFASTLYIRRFFSELSLSNSKSFHLSSVELAFDSRLLQSNSNRVSSDRSSFASVLYNSDCQHPTYTSTGTLRSFNSLSLLPRGQDAGDTVDSSSNLGEALESVLRQNTDTPRLSSDSSDSDRSRDLVNLPSSTAETCHPAILQFTVNCGACGTIDRSKTSCTCLPSSKSLSVFHPSSEVPCDGRSVSLASPGLSVGTVHSCIVASEDKCSATTALTCSVGDVPSHIASGDTTALHSSVGDVHSCSATSDPECSSATAITLSSSGPAHTMEQTSSLVCSEMDNMASSSSLHCTDMQDSAGAGISSAAAGCCSDKLVQKAKSDSLNNNDNGNRSMPNSIGGPDVSLAECNGVMNSHRGDELDNNKNIIIPPQQNSVGNLTESAVASTTDATEGGAASSSYRDGSSSSMAMSTGPDPAAQASLQPSTEHESAVQPLEMGAAVMANGQQAEPVAMGDPANESILNELATVLADTTAFKSEPAMQSECDSNNYVSLETLLATAPIRPITSDVELLKKALEKADSKWEMDGATGRARVRSSRNVLILREMEEEITQEEILGIFTGELCPPVQSARYVAGGCWYITFNSGEEAYQAFRYLHEYVKCFNGEPIKARIKSNQATPMTTFSGGHGRGGGGTGQPQQQQQQQPGVAGVAITTAHMSHIQGGSNPPVLYHGPRPGSTPGAMQPSPAASGSTSSVATGSVSSTAAGSPLLFHPHTLHPHHHHHHHHPAAVVAAPGTTSLAQSHLTASAAAAAAACYPAQQYYNLQHPIFYPSQIMTQWNPHNNFMDFSQFVSFNGLNPTNTYKPSAGQLGLRFANGNTSNMAGSAAANSSGLGTSKAGNRSRDNSRASVGLSSSVAVSSSSGGGPHSLPPRLFSRPHSSPSPSAPLPSAHTNSAYACVPYSSYSQPSQQYAVPYSYGSIQPQQQQQQHQQQQQQQLPVSVATSLQQHYQQQDSSSAATPVQQHLNNSIQQLSQFQLASGSNSTSVVASDNSSSNSTTTQQDSGRSSPLLSKTETPPVPPLLSLHHSKGSNDSRSPNAPLIPQPPFLHSDGSHNSPLMGAAPIHSLHHRNRYNNANSNNSNYHNVYGHQRGGGHPVNMGVGGGVHRHPSYHHHPHHHHHHHPSSYGPYGGGGPPHHYMGRDVMPHRTMRGMPPRSNISNNNNSNSSNSNNSHISNLGNNNNSRGRQRQRDDGPCPPSSNDDRQGNAGSSHRVPVNNRHNDSNRGQQQKHQPNSNPDSTSRSNNSSASLSSNAKNSQAQQVQVQHQQQQFALESDSFPPLPGADEASVCAADAINSSNSTNPVVASAAVATSLGDDQPAVSSASVTVASTSLPVTSSGNGTSAVAATVAVATVETSSAKGSDAVVATNGPKFSDVMKKPRAEMPVGPPTKTCDAEPASLPSDVPVVSGSSAAGDSAAMPADIGKEQRQPRAPRNRRTDAGPKSGSSGNNKVQGCNNSNKTVPSVPTPSPAPAAKVQQNNSSCNNNSTVVSRSVSSSSKTSYASGNTSQTKGAVTSSNFKGSSSCTTSTQATATAVTASVVTPQSPEKVEGNEDGANEAQDGGDDGGWITKKAKEPRGHRNAFRGGRDHHHAAGPVGGGHYSGRSHKEQGGYSGYHQPMLNGNASPPPTPSASRAAPPAHKTKPAKSGVAPDAEEKALVSVATSVTATPAAASQSNNGSSVVAAAPAAAGAPTSAPSEASEPVTTWARIAGQGPKKAPAPPVAAGTNDSQGKDPSSTAGSSTSTGTMSAASTAAPPPALDKEKRSTATRPTRGTGSRLPGIQKTNRGGGRGGRGGYGPQGRGGSSNSSVGTGGRREQHNHREYSNSYASRGGRSQQHYRHDGDHHHHHHHQHHYSNSDSSRHSQQPPSRDVPPSAPLPPPPPASVGPSATRSK